MEVFASFTGTAPAAKEDAVVIADTDTDAEKVRGGQKMYLLPCSSARAH